MLGTHHKIIGLISPLPTILGNVLNILVVLKIIVSYFPVVWGVFRVTESAQKNVGGVPIANNKYTTIFTIRNPAVWGTPRTNVRLICRLSRETKQYPIRKRAHRRRKHNKRRHGAALKDLDTIIVGEIFFYFFIFFIVIYRFPLA